MIAALTLAAALLTYGMVPIGITMHRHGPRWFATMPRARAVLRTLTALLAVAAVLQPLDAAAVAMLTAAAFFWLLSFVMHPDVLFPSSTDPRAIDVEGAAVSAGATVVGVVVGAQARAYLLDDVARLHLVNDTLAGQSVLVSYCPLCKSAVVYDANVRGTRLLFTVAGFWRRNMLMRDQLGGIWQQTSGECLHGPSAGVALPPLAYEQCTLDVWRRDHPASTLMQGPAARPFDFRRAIPLEWGFAKFAGRINAMPPFSHGRVDPRLAPTIEVAGIVHAGESRAFSLPALTRVRVVEESAFGTRIRVSYDARANRVSCEDTARRQLVPVKRELWVAWSEFHPGTSVWNGEEEGRPSELEATDPGVR